MWRLVYERSRKTKLVELFVLSDVEKEYAERNIFTLKLVTKIFCNNDSMRKVKAKSFCDYGYDFICKAY